MMTKKIMKSMSLVLALVMMLSLAGCVTSGNDQTTAPAPAEKVYTYNDYLTLSPSNWNELTYQDSNDTNIMSYINSSFFGYDFKYDAEGNIVSGEYEVVYEAATKLEDVTAKYAEAWGLPADGKGYAYKITLREDLKWENGDPIKAEDFVYTMQQQLDPLFQNYRADSFYAGATIIVNAEAYVKQGSTQLADNSASGKYTVADLIKGDDGVYTQPDGKPVYFALTTPLAWCGGYSVTDYSSYMDADSFAALEALADENGNVPVTDDTIALVTTLIDTDDWGHEPPENVPYYMVYEFTYEAVDFADVGIFVGNTDYELVVVLEKALDLLNEDGTLSYKAAYNFASLPLVHKATYEANKVAPSEGTDLWTSTYNSSAETTMSWGPYKLESYQFGKQHILVKNDNWFGYGLEENEGLYQTDRIVCEIVKDWNSAWVLFQAGKVDGIGIDVSIADDYKTSSRAYFTPSDFVSSLQLQSDGEALKAREEEGINKTLLTYTEFRQALSLSINRAEFTATCTTASKEGFGLFNSMHYYDVANGGVYRNTDEGKQALCDVYGVDVSKYASLDDAVAAISGYNLELARQKLTEAYNAALAAGDISATDKVKLVFGSGSITEAVTRQFNYIKASWEKLCETTPLEGRLELVIEDKGTNWAKDFRAGAYDVCMGGWSGAAWDPGYFLLAYLDAGYRYAAAWDTTAQMMTFTMKGVGENGEDITETMSLMDWYYCLNGMSDKYDWSSNALEESQRLQLIAALEVEVLKTYYAVPLANSFSASMLSYKVEYITYEYNTFMGYGGFKYMTYNYDDAAWEEVLTAQNNELDYKK